MDLIEYVLPFNGTYKNFTRKQKLDFLKSLYLNMLVEDAQDGTAFDLAVLDSIEKLQETFGGS